ncbi:MAG: C40 family peptidase [Lachnospiraceae bacterium]|nr:C40 family peptidase [Lachnospiraceae bacterium]
MKKKTFRKKYSVKKTIVAVAASVSVFASCFSFLPAYVHAEPEKTLTEEEQKKLEEKKKQEEEVKKQQEQTQKDLQEKNKEVGALEKEQSAVQSQIADLNAQISNLMSDIDILEYDIANTEAAIEVAKEELDEATALEAEQYEATKTRIKIMYEQGETNYVDLLVSSSSFSEFLTNAEYIEKVYQYDQKLLSDYQDTKKQVQEMKEELEIEEADLEAQKEDLVTQKAELDSKMSSLRAIAADYDNQISAAKKQAEQYAKLIKQQNAQIKSLQAEEKALTTPTVTTTTPVTTGAEGGTAIMTGTIVSAGPNAKFHGAQYQIDTGVITSARGSDKGKEVALYAIQFLGNPYVHAGRSLITGTDCSGFTSLVYAHFGIKISPGVAYQRTQGRSVTYEEAEPGDVIFYPGHAALYLGNGKIIHASSSKTGIKISNANYRSYTNIQRMLP